MRYDGYRHEGIVYRRVTWPGFKEAEDYTEFTGGSLELSALSDLRASGSLDLNGSALPTGHDLVRVYYVMRDQDGNEEQRPLGTFFLSVAEPTIGAMTKGTVTLESTLRVPLNDAYGRPYTVKAGTNAVAKAVEIIEGFGLRTNRPTAGYRLAKDVTYESDDSYLKIVNDLLSMAGYASCWPDPWGTIQMAPYVEPTDREPSWSFSDGEGSVMLPEVKRSDNSDDIPNAVKLIWESEDESIWASAYNRDPNSGASIVSRGYEVSMCDKESELQGGTTAERLSALKAKARQTLIDNSSSIEYVEWGHPILPLQPNDSVSISYAAANFTWRGAITAMEVKLDAHPSVQSKARRFVRGGFEVDVEGGTW